MIPHIALFMPIYLTDTRSGLRADERAITAKGVPVTAVSTGSATRNDEGLVEVTEATPSILVNQIDEAIRTMNPNVVKIGR